MKVCHHVIVGLLGILLSELNTGCLFGQDINAIRADIEATTDVDSAALALQWIDTCRANKLPEGIVSGVLMLHRLGANPNTEMPIEGEVSLPINLDSLLDEANAIRSDDKELGVIVARAKEELKEKPRGAVSGPRMTRISVNPGKDWSMKIKFAAKKPVSVVVCGAIGFPTYLKVSILNSNGKVVATAEGWSNKGVNPQFTPSATEEFSVRVQNQGKHILGNGYLTHN